MMLGLALGLPAISTVLAFAQAKTSLPVYIPSKLAYNATPGSSSPYPQIGVAKLNVSMTSANPVVFTITDSTGTPLQFPALTPGGTKQTLTFPSGDTVSAQPNASPGNPYQYEIDYVLRSDSNPNDCRGLMQTNQKTYTVSVRSGDPMIARACLESYDGLFRTTALPASCSNAALGANLIPIPLDNAKDKVASFDPNNQPAQECVSFIAPNPPGNVRGAARASGISRASTRQTH
jgi:hypothetical protein